MRAHALCLCVAAAAVAVCGVLVGGCGSASLIEAYTGGGLPPGDPDIGGVVLQETVAQSSVGPQQTTPVVGAEVVLYRGQQRVGQTLTGPGGFFRFGNPRTGSYRVRVTPPAGSGLSEAERQFEHRAGEQTFLTIILEPV